jgi:hypothetical protein
MAWFEYDVFELEIVDWILMFVWSFRGENTSFAELEFV